MLKKLNLGLVALVLGFGLTITTSAFKPAKTDIQWNFIGDQLSEATDGHQYSTTMSPPTSCNSGTAVPCYLTTPETVDTQDKLNQYIEDTYGDDAAAVRDAAPAKRAL
ncbi:hypothetical protein H9N25_12975 [Pedobacter riviphilus]|uniref:Uncharacterized protein n=1 Tax=Pedobacter riviphilus TaxID=2766984 RepID=A0ABX6TD47_9SPHI|nr:hypothetical protein [Pedobacter riviphilus]QNR82901.1 hypothetical protein H9N25_12975 [Pedobacter riviphilus]